MGGIEPAELGEELSGLDLQVPSQRHRLQIRFLGLDSGLAFRIDLKDDVGLPSKVRVHFALEGGFQILNCETSFFGIVTPQLRAALDVIGRRGSGGDQRVE